MNRLLEKYNKEVKEAIVKEFDIKNAMEIPAIQKIVINTGMGDMSKTKEYAESIKRDIAAITGQAPSVRLAKVSIATFNLRRGMPVGLSVTLRGGKMYDFLERLFTVTLPRIRDFRGISRKSFDKNGNYTLGIVEHTIFPEVDITKVTKAQGMEVTIVINSGSPEVSEKLLELLGMPFEKGQTK
jgi:large subunit ribosomal protein L5